MVAPRVGAWIETLRQGTDYVGELSHPVWVRGLKLLYAALLIKRDKSHPVWVRGLKHRY